EDDQPPAVRQRARASAARPTVRPDAEQMLARLFRQSFDLLEVYDHQLGEVRQGERVERIVVAPQAREIAQAQRTQFILSPLDSWRQSSLVHALDDTCPRALFHFVSVGS